MNWEIVASTGEWAGAIAVIASLLYLARQIKAATVQSQATARYSFLDAYGQANAAIAESEQSASVFRRGLNNEELSDDQRMQFVLQLGQFLNTWSVMYDLHEEGQLPPNQWALVRTDILTAFTTPGGRLFWTTVGKLNGHENFSNLVDKLIESGESGYPLVLSTTTNSPAGERT